MTDTNLFFSKKLMIIDISTFIIGIGLTFFSLCFADSLFLGQNQGISRFLDTRWNQLVKIIQFC